MRTKLRVLKLALLAAGVVAVVVATLPARASHPHRDIARVRAGSGGIGRAVTFIRVTRRGQYIRGTAADDTIYSRDGFRNVITCGPGRDLVIADRFDRVDRSCERVLRR